MSTVSGVGNRNYVSGLVSGMDTEEMVEKMLSGTQAKIDKQTGLQQQLEWKQEIYRDLIQNINSFRDKYFSFYSSANTNLLSRSFYNTMSVMSSSDAVKVTSASSQAPANLTIQSVDQLATAAKVTSKNPVKMLAGSLPAVNTTSPDKTYTMDVTVDGVTKKISFQGAADQAGLLENVNKAMYQSFGSAVGLGTDGGRLKLVQINADGTGKIGSDGRAVESDPSRQVTFQKNEDGEDALAALGLSDGATNIMGYNTMLRDLPFATALQGRSFSFTINGTVIDGIKDTDTLGDVINKINNRSDVKITYSSLEDRFVMQSKATGSVADITMENKEGNLLSAMFGLGTGDSVTAGTDELRAKLSAVVSGTGLADVVSAANAGTAQVFSLNVNGTNYSVSVGKKEDGTDYADGAEFIDALNEKLKKAFGETDGSANIEIRYDGTNAEVISDRYLVSFQTANVESDVTKALGFTDGQTQKVGKSTLLSDAGIAGTISVAGSSLSLSGLTFQELADQITNAVSAASPGAQAVFDEETGSLSITGAGANLSVTGLDAEGSKALQDLFGTDTLVMNQAGTQVNDILEAGKNAVFTVDNGGVSTTVERYSNTFDLEGITIELTQVSTTPIHLTTAQDTDKILEGIKGFVDDYNKLIEDLNARISEEATYKKYAPLTADQKKEMSEREIELWEEKAKAGLLRNDDNVSTLLSDMRTVLYQKVDSAGLSLYDIGIDTSSNWRDNGKLILDENKLKEALAKNPDQVQLLFTDEDQGIAVKMDAALKAAANLSSGSPGSMVRYAGTKSILSNDNTIYDQLKDIQTALSNLNRKYESERERYWKQFTEMEKAISNLNTQSSFISQQFSSSNG
ncbi:flagellar filament capping protein FliD [Diplocloster hominis]|uniref:flagellar filament capping protein FliD n=1 Tax=Diplocloster hominis TaxID=3079010 RepID=UPI0031BA0E52